MFWIHLKKVGAIISSEILVNARAIHETISSSNGFFWWSVIGKAWIPPAIHYIQPFHYCRNTKSYRTEVDFRGTGPKLANTAVTLQSRDLQRCHKQADFHVSPSHHGSHAEFQIHVRLSSEFLAFMILDWSPQKWILCVIGCSFYKQEGQFQVGRNRYFFIGSVLLFK